MLRSLRYCTGAGAGAAACAAKLFHLLTVVTLGDELRLRAEHVVEAVVRVLDRARAPADAELLRRDALDAGTFAGAADLYGHVVQLGCRQWTSIRTNRRLHARGQRRFALAVLDNLDVGQRHDQRKSIVRLIEIGLALDFLPAFPPHVDHADLGQERILDEGIEHQKAVVLLHEDVVDVIGFLLGGGDVLWADRRELHHLFAGSENLHQRRHQAFDRVGDVARDRLAAPVRSRHVFCHVAHVVIQRRGALVGELRGRHGGQRVVALRRKQRLEIDRGHLRHGCFRHRRGSPPCARESSGGALRPRAIRPLRCLPEEAGIETLLNSQFR
jgi:hypothetical protein